MANSRRCLLVVCVSLFFGAVLLVSGSGSSKEQSQPEVSTRKKNRSSSPPAGYETQKECEMRRRRWKKSDEAKEALEKMREQECEEFKARQAERRRRKAEEGSMEPLENKVALLERKVARLERRMDLLEGMLSGEGPPSELEEPGSTMELKSEQE